MILFYPITICWYGLLFNTDTIHHRESVVNLYLDTGYDESVSVTGWDWIVSSVSGGDSSSSGSDCGVFG